MPAKTDFPDMPGVEVERETVRRLIAFVAMGGFLAIVLLIIAVALFGQTAHPPRPTIEDTVKLLTAVSAVLSGVVGAIVGFYFNNK